MLRSFAFGLFTYFLKKWKSRTLGAIRMGGHALETYVDCLEHELKPEMYQCLIINRQWWRQLIKTLKIRRISDHSLISTVDDTITLGVKVKRPWH